MEISINGLKRYLNRRTIQWTHFLAQLTKNRSFYIQEKMDMDERSCWHNVSFIKQHGGFFLKEDNIKRNITEFDAWDNVRKDMLILLMRTINDHKVKGYMAELGVYRGVSAKLIHHYMPDRMLHLFDTFQGFPQQNCESEIIHTGCVEKPSSFSDTSIEMVRSYIKPINDNIKFHQGFFPASVPSYLDDECFAFVHLDADLFEPTMAGLNYFYPKMSSRGCIVIHDYNTWLGARKAVDQFFSDKPETPLPMPDKSGSVVVIKH